MKTNHRRGFKAKAYTYGGGAKTRSVPNPYRTFPDKSMQSWGDTGELSGKSVGASIGNDFTNGNRGMAKAVRGAKKFVRTRIRFHENAALKKIANELGDD